MAKKFTARIRVKGVTSSVTTVEVFANNVFDARKIIVTQYAGGDKSKVSWFSSPREVR